MELLEKAREARKSPAVVKVRLSQLRSRYQEHPILVLEGIDDVGPYETWINRITDARALKMLAGSGKEQLLALRTLLQRDETGLRARVFFAIDRDFDGLLGQAPGQDIFCTDRYSVENYLIDEHVVGSVLRDEFRLDEHSVEFEAAMQAYRSSLHQFLETFGSVNFRIYCCRRLQVRVLAAMPDVRRFARIHVRRVEANVGPELLDQELPTAAPLAEDSVQELRNDFALLDPTTRHRGKFLFQFLIIWLERLADEARNPSGQVFRTRLNIKFSSTSVTLRSLACRSQMPAGLREFVSSMFAVPT